MEMIGGSSASYLPCTRCIPLFCTLFYRDGNRRVFTLPGEGGDHFHCAVEPSPGHMWCQFLSFQNYDFAIWASECNCHRKCQYNKNVVLAVAIPIKYISDTQTCFQS